MTVNLVRLTPKLSELATCKYNNTLITLFFIWYSKSSPMLRQIDRRVDKEAEYMKNFLKRIIPSKITSHQQGNGRLRCTTEDVTGVSNSETASGLVTSHGRNVLWRLCSPLSLPWPVQRSHRRLWLLRFADPQWRLAMKRHTRSSGGKGSSKISSNLRCVSSLIGSNGATFCSDSMLLWFKSSNK